MLEGQSLSYCLGPVTLFSNLSFFLNRGEKIGIKGGNGAGKTTLLRVLAGLRPSSSGTLLWQEKALTPSSLSVYQQNLLYVGHQLCLHPEGCIKDHLQIWRHLYGVSNQILEDALYQWGLHLFKHKKISHLSQGQQKRLSLSRCSWLNRPLWILDEPHAVLDREGKYLLNQQIENHLERGGLVILATHEDVSYQKEIHL